MVSYIEPKPTRYKKVLYRSRLEARWAVFLDGYKDLKDCAYESFVIKLKSENYRDQYIPDFSFRWPLVSNKVHFLEVKPRKPTNEYYRRLALLSKMIPNPILIAFGSFYKTQPLIHTFNGKGFGTLTKPIPLNLLFPRSTAAIKRAAGYRFDLH